jgi:hypothetical protein
MSWTRPPRRTIPQRMPSSFRSKIQLGSSNGLSDNTAFIGTNAAGMTV